MSSSILYSTEQVIIPRFDIKHVTVKQSRNIPAEDMKSVIICTVNSRLADTPLLQTLAITDKIQIPIYRGLTENDSRYYGLSLFRTQNDFPKVSAIRRIDCNSSCLWRHMIR